MRFGGHLEANDGQLGGLGNAGTAQRQHCRSQESKERGSHDVVLKSKRR
jgi:hypothetical protein